MSSRRRSGLDSRNSRSNVSNSSKLRMDSRPQQPRITDPSLPAGRRREIDTVMKKARSSPNANGYWDKKLLEVEAKDPNRWRHTGYKSMYVGGSSSPSPGRSRARRTRSRSARSRSRSRSYGRPASSSAATARAPRSAPRPRSPPQRPPPRRSPSASSLSSCSDDSCSVCSPKNRTRDRRIRSRSRSYSIPRSRNTQKTAPTRSSKQVAAVATSSRATGRPRAPPAPLSPPMASASSRRAPTNNHKAPNTKPSDPRRAPITSTSRVRRDAAHHAVIELSPSPRSSAPTVEVSQAAAAAAAARATARNTVRKKKERKDKEKVLLTRIKTERSKKRRLSPPAESSGSEDSSSSSLGAVVAATRLTLSERFGKMAQWSVDRRDIENMRITKNSSSGDLKVMIEEERMYEDPPLRYSHSPAPIGHFPDELMATGPSGLAAWDDVRVRYQYYKDLGYLRDLTLDDYIKWEQWWYKYQEWLKNERYYEHWINSQSSRRRRKRLPATQRLN